MAAATIPGCAVCGGNDKLLKCGWCKNVSYCSRDHQRKHWPKHKFDCDHSKDETLKYTTKDCLERIRSCQPSIPKAFKRLGDLLLQHYQRKIEIKEPDPEEIGKELEELGTDVEFCTKMLRIGGPPLLKYLEDFCFVNGGWLNLDSDLEDDELEAAASSDASVHIVCSLVGRLISTHVLNESAAGNLKSKLDPAFVFLEKLLKGGLAYNKARYCCGRSMVRPAQSLFDVVPLHLLVEAGVIMGVIKEVGDPHGSERSSIIKMLERLMPYWSQQPMEVVEKALVSAIFPIILYSKEDEEKEVAKKVLAQLEGVPGAIQELSFESGVANFLMKENLMRNPRTVIAGLEYFGQLAFEQKEKYYGHKISDMKHWYS